MTTATAILSGLTFVWLGMVLAISFLEAPLKFRAPGVTVPIGLGIGRIVFRALNIVEVVLALVIAGTLAMGAAGAGAVVVWAVIVAIALAGQLGAVRPRLNRRSDRILAGENAPRSRAHLAYIALEAVKVVSLAGMGVTALTA